MKKSIKTTIVCFLIMQFSSIYLNAQGLGIKRIDSLLSLLSHSKEDTNEIKLLNKLALYYIYDDPKEGIRLSKKSIELAETLNWNKRLNESYVLLGTSYWAYDNFYSASKYCWKSSKMLSYDIEIENLGECLQNIGMFYYTQQEYSRALEYLRIALEKFKQENNDFGVVSCYSSIASIFYEQKIYDSAIANFKSSLNITKDINNKPIADVATLERIGFIYFEIKNYAKAIQFQERALRMSIKYDLKDETINITGEIGITYLYQKNFFKSLEYFAKAVELSEHANTYFSYKTNFSKRNLGKYLGEMGKAYLAIVLNAGPNLIRSKDSLKDSKILLDKAVYNLKRASDILDSINDTEKLKEVLKNLCDAYILQGNYSEANKIFNKYANQKYDLGLKRKGWEEIEMYIEYINNKKKEAVEKQKYIHEIELKNLSQLRKNDKLTIRQQWLYGIIGFVILLFSTSYYFYRYRVKQLRLKNELLTEKSEKELKQNQYQRQLNDITFSLLRSQMNPHFIFNALNTIKSFVYTNDKLNAANYLDKFSDLLRKTLANSSKQIITLEEEIELLQLYIDIEKSRFGDQLNAIIEVDSSFETQEIMIPPMLIQPYVENAIKHGLLHIDGEKKLIISICKSTDEKYIKIIIEDFGIGVERSQEINKMRLNHNSFAVAANAKMIDLLNKLYSKNAKITILDKKNGDGVSTGTLVTLDIPINLFPDT